MQGNQAFNISHTVDSIGYTETVLLLRRLKKQTPHGLEFGVGGGLKEVEKMNSSPNRGDVPPRARGLTFFDNKNRCWVLGVPPAVCQGWHGHWFDAGKEFDLDAGAVSTLLEELDIGPDQWRVRKGRLWFHGSVYWDAARISITGLDDWLQRQQ